MLQVASDEHQVVLSADFDGVAHHAVHARAVLHECEFHLFMLVKRVVIVILLVVHHVETVVFGEWSDFGDDFFHDMLPYFLKMWGKYKRILRLSQIIAMILLQKSVIANYFVKKVSNICTVF